MASLKRSAARSNVTGRARASQRILLRTGFAQYGMAPKYLKIAGRWQDHLMFQLLNPQP
jgi:[ribosomal protein S5]-alanine N-acetyltransferase